MIRVVFSTTLGWLLAFTVPPLVGVAPRWGVVGLSASSGLAGWVELLLLRRVLRRRIGRTRLEGGLVLRLWAAATMGAVVAWGVKLVVPPASPLLIAPPVLAAYALTYLGAATALRVPEALNTVRAAVAVLRSRAL